MHLLAGIRAPGFEEDITAVGCVGRAGVATGTQRGSLLFWRRGSGSEQGGGGSGNALEPTHLCLRDSARVVRLLSGSDGTLALHADGTLTLWSDDGECLASRTLSSPFASPPLLASSSSSSSSSSSATDGVVVVVVAAPLKQGQQQQGVPSERPPAPPTALFLDWRTLDEVEGGVGAAARPSRQLARVAGMPDGGDRALAAAVSGTELHVVMASGWLFGVPLSRANEEDEEEEGDEEDEKSDEGEEEGVDDSGPLSSAAFSGDGSLLLTVSRGAWRVYRRRARRRDSRWVAVMAVVEEEEAASKTVRFQGAAAAAAASTPISATRRHYVGGAVLRHSTAGGADLVLWDATGAADWVRCAFDGGGKVLLHRSIDFGGRAEPIIDFAASAPGGFVAHATRRRVWLITAGTEGAGEEAAFTVQQGSIDRSIGGGGSCESILPTMIDRLPMATAVEEGGSAWDDDDDEGGAYAMAVGGNLWADDHEGAAAAALPAAAAPATAAAAPAPAPPPLSPMYLGARRVAFFPLTGGVSIVPLAACCLPGASDRFSSASTFSASERDVGDATAAAVVTCALRAPCATLLVGAADGSVRALALSTAVDDDDAVDDHGRSSTSTSVVVGTWHLHTAPVRRMLLPPLDSPAPWDACVLTAADDGTLAVFNMNVDQKQSAGCRFFAGFPYGCPTHVAWHPASGVLVAGAVVGKKELCVWAWDLASGGLDRVLRGDEASRLLDRLSQQQQQKQSIDRSVDRDCFAAVEPPHGSGGGFLILDIDVSAVLTAAASHHPAPGAVADAASALGVLLPWGIDSEIDSEVASLLNGLGLITDAEALRARKVCIGGLVRGLVATGGGFAVGFDSSFSLSPCRLAALVAMSDLLRGQCGVSNLGKLVDLCAARLCRPIDRPIGRSTQAAAHDTRLLASLTVHPTGPLRRAARWLLARRLLPSAVGADPEQRERAEAAAALTRSLMLEKIRGGVSDVESLCSVIAASCAPSSSAIAEAATPSLLALLSCPSLAGALAAKQLARLLRHSSPLQQQPSFSRSDLFIRLSAVFETGLHASRDPQELALLMLQQQQQSQQQQKQLQFTATLFCAIAEKEGSPSLRVPFSEAFALLRDARAGAEDELFRQPADAAWTSCAIELAGTLCASPDFFSCLQVVAATLSSEKEATTAFVLAAIFQGVAAIMEGEESARDHLLPHLGLLGVVAVQAVDQARPTLRSMCSESVKSIVSSLERTSLSAAAGGLWFLGNAVARRPPPAAPSSSCSASFMLPVAVALPLATGGPRRVVCLLPLATTTTTTTTAAAADAAAAAADADALLPPPSLPPSAATSRARVSDAELGMSGLDRWWGSDAAASSTAAGAAATAAAAAAAPSAGRGSPAPSTDSLIKLSAASSSGVQVVAAAAATEAAEIPLGLRLLHAGRAFYPSRPARSEPLFAIGGGGGGDVAVALRASVTDGRFFAAAWLAELEVVVVWRLSALPFGGGGGETTVPHAYLPVTRSGELCAGDLRLVWAGDELLELRRCSTVLWSSAVMADPLAGEDE